MTPPDQKPSIGPFGALSIGIGGIVGGGFFATFGMTVAGARGGTPVAFLIGGVIALVTAFSYIGLTLRYPGAGGTVSFIRIAFGRGILAASINILLILSYVAMMSVYAGALASYSIPYLPSGIQPIARHVIPSVAIVVFALVNFAGASLMNRLESFFNVGKLGVLAIFIVGGLIAGQLEWSRLEPSSWAPPSAVIASGMLGFLAYEGFELIANASDNIANPKRTLPIAFLGSVIFAIVVYVLAFIVGIGHLSFEATSAAADFAISAAADAFLGPIGFAIMAVGAILASASAINADYFGAAKLPPQLAAEDELPSAFHRSIRSQTITSLITIAVLALVAINFLDLHAISAATSGGFLIVFASVNLAAVRLRHETGTHLAIPAIAAALCAAAFVMMAWQFLSDPATIASGIAVGAIIVLAVSIELVFRSLESYPPKMVGNDIT